MLDLLNVLNALVIIDEDPVFLRYVKLDTGCCCPVTHRVQSFNRFMKGTGYVRIGRYKYITQEQGQAIHMELPALCKEVRPHALALVQSFGFPHHILGPIAFDWVDFEAWKYAEGKVF